MPGDVRISSHPLWHDPAVRSPCCVSRGGSRRERCTRSAPPSASRHRAVVSLRYTWWNKNGAARRGLSLSASPWLRKSCQNHVVSPRTCLSFCYAGGPRSGASSFPRAVQSSASRLSGNGSNRRSRGCWRNNPEGSHEHHERAGTRRGWGVWAVESGSGVAYYLDLRGRTPRVVRVPGGTGTPCSYARGSTSCGS